MLGKVNKEIIDKFKKTEYGKKITKMLFLSVIISAVLFLISCIAFFSVGAGTKTLNTTTDLILNILFGITAVSIVVSCYFDGKRDGAIEQFRIVKKK